MDGNLWIKNNFGIKKSGVESKKKIENVIKLFVNNFNKKIIKFYLKKQWLLKEKNLLVVEKS